MLQSFKVAVEAIKVESDEMAIPLSRVMETFITRHIIIWKSVSAASNMTCLRYDHCSYSLTRFRCGNSKHSHPKSS